MVAWVDEVHNTSFISLALLTYILIYENLLSLSRGTLVLLAQCSFFQPFLLLLFCHINTSYMKTCLKKVCTLPDTMVVESFFHVAVF